MLRRILFCDVDGVLNTSTDKDPDFMNLRYLNILNRLQEELGFEIILSSTWRLIFDQETFNRKFLGFGAKYPVVGYTPGPWQLDDEVYTTLHGTTHVYQGWSKHGHEIQRWLDENDLVPGENVSICIIDDMGVENFGSLSKYFIMTSMEKGLHEGHVKHIRKIFAKQEKAE